jgi:hypothetical protein
MINNLLGYRNARKKSVKSIKAKTFYLQCDLEVTFNAKIYRIPDNINGF